jgi:release factor glutamine methyltransferase
MNWKEAIETAKSKFIEANIDDARDNAEYIAAHVLGFWSKSEMRTYYLTPLSEDDQKHYESLIARRLAHEPLQHVIGETEFYGLRLFTSPAALIPRPETEILVEEALRESSGMRNIQILDIGTGSGAIALALATRLPESTITGVDISADAIALAKKNKARLGADNTIFEEINIFREEFQKKYHRAFDMILSNPPYISAEEFETLEPEVKDFDPRIALTDEADGLIFYRRIAEIASEILKANGKIIVEIGYGSLKEVEKIFTGAGLAVIRIVKDLQGIERVLVINTPD